MGKSSFINSLLGRKNLARTSSVPGKTTTINFYNVDESLYFVDLPGYGYAKRPKTEIKKWGQMIETYLFTREQLCATILIVDARHKPTADDISMLEWIRARHQKAIVIATKIDKLKKTQVQGNIDAVRQTLSLGDEDTLIPFSAEKGYGREEAWAAVLKAADIGEIIGI